ncbi:MAG: amidohydrolase [Pirellulales bacterium]
MPLTPDEAMRRIEVQLTHVWMVRTFLKHSEEADLDEELREVHRTLYDYPLALGEPWENQDAATYLKLAHKKFARLRQACDDFARIQPEVSTHTNFQMAVESLTAAVGEIGRVLEETATAG